MWLKLTFLMLTQVPLERPLSPMDSVVQAAADCSKLQPGYASYTRYLSLYNLPAAERIKAIAVLNGHCNMLSREPDLIPVSIVPGTLGSLVRINLQDYRWSGELWEKLSDPYFTDRVDETEVVVIWYALKKGDTWQKGRPWEDGKVYDKPFTVGADFPAVTEIRRKGGGKNVQALAPWLTTTPEGKNAVETLVRLTGSRIPVVRADWFFNQTAAAAGRSPNYYDFLGVKDEASFQRAIGADIKLAEEFGAELREAVAISGVTLNPRAIVRHPTLGGGYWRTFDFKTSKGDKNPLKVLGKDVEASYDATEQFGHLPNGLWATFLGNRKGEVQATAPDDIASDGFARGTDRRVHSNVSCVRCHSDGGLQPIDGWARNLLEPPFAITTLDYQRARDLRRQYLRKLEPFLTKDRLVYELSIQEVTGLKTSKEFSAAYAATWERYEDARVDLARAAADLGCTPKEFEQDLMVQVKANYGSTVLSALLGKGIRPRAIPVRVWEEAYPEAQAIRQRQNAVKGN